MKPTYKKHRSHINVGKMYGLICAALQAFAPRLEGKRCFEITHVECKVKPSGEITALLVCASLDEDGKTMAELYAEFTPFLKKTMENLYGHLYGGVAPRTFIGFNYDNPGIIKLNGEKVTYHPELDFSSGVPFMDESLSRVIGTENKENFADVGFDLWKKGNPGLIKPYKKK